MKLTSYIFLVFAAILLVGGLMTCSVAETMAKTQNISIFEQKKDKKGNNIYTYKLTDEKLSKLNLNFSNVDVKIVGTEKESYVELKNFDAYDYATTLSGTTVTVDGTVSSISSIIDLSGGGLRFKGFRYLFANKTAKNAKRSVTVYISDSCDLSSLSINLEKGSVTVSNIYNKIDYNITVNSGNVSFNNVSTESMINLEVNSGEIDVENTECITLNASLVSCKTSFDLTKYNNNYITYNVKTENSTVVHNGSLDDDGQFVVTVSTDLQKNMVKITAIDSEIILKDSAV